MKYQDPHQLPDAEKVPSLDGIVTLPRRERLMRWADALEAHHEKLNALREIEYLSPEERRAYRGSNTPLTIAFKDPVLREAGLSDDNLGTAMDFFEMTDEDAHRLLCDCHYMGTMTGSGLAHRIRHFAEHGGGGVMSWARSIFAERGH
jgi:hypothetical protein